MLTVSIFQKTTNDWLMMMMSDVKAWQNRAWAAEDRVQHLEARVQELKETLQRWYVVAEEQPLLSAQLFKADVDALDL